MKRNIYIAIAVLAVAIVSIWLIRGRQQPSQSKTQIKFSGQTLDQLPEAKPQATVELKNGDVFNLTADIIKKKIGNLEVKMLGYNGSVPGPLIKVAKGSEVTINFTNNTDVPTTIHSHGVRLTNAFDGVPDVTQKEVGIGESFTYKIKFPDEGMYWYHPHIREDYAQELGLYGNFLVSSNDPSYWSPVNQEQALFIDDVLFDDNGISAFDPQTADHTLMGRFGDVMMVNGETNYQINAKKGEVVRLYLTNAANTRTFRVMLPGAKMKLVGGDSGKYEKEQFVDEIIISPSERAIVDALFDQAGSFMLEHKSSAQTYPLAKINVSAQETSPSYAAEFNTLRTNKDTQASIDPFRSAFDKQSDKSITLAVNMGAQSSAMNQAPANEHMMHSGMMMPNSQMTMGEVQKIEWEDDMDMMNTDSTTKTLTWQLTDGTTGKKNMDIDWKFKVGDKVKIKIFNDPNAMHPMQHPIHFHGQRFLVLSTNGVKNDNLVWKDTALIQTGDTVELLVDMSNPGTWMAHCHIAEHLEAGMMLKYQVE